MKISVAVLFICTNIISSWNASHWSKVLSNILIERSHHINLLSMESPIASLYVTVNAKSFDSMNSWFMELLSAQRFHLPWLNSSNRFDDLMNYLQKILHSNFRFVLFLFPSIRFGFKGFGQVLMTWITSNMVFGISRTYKSKIWE